MRKMLTEKKLENKEYGKELIDYIVCKTFGSNPKAPDKKRESGTGFSASKVLLGRGKDTSNDELEQKFDQFDLKKDVSEQN